MQILKVGHAVKFLWGALTLPYRHAYLWIVLLFPAVTLAFWPSYFARLPEVSWILHAHGVTASLWIALTGIQAWSISRDRRPIHRFAGRTSLALFPIFWTSGLLIIQVMAAGFLAKDNPFHSTYGARLTPVDILTSITILYLYYVALSQRKSVLTHAAAMLAIPFFLLPPIFVRILQVGGPFAIRGPDEFYKFGYGLELCNALSIAATLWLWSRQPKTAWPFLFAAAAIALQSFAFETIGRSPSWERALVTLADVPTGVIAGLGLVISSAVVWLGWTGPVNSRDGGSGGRSASTDEQALSAS